MRRSSVVRRALPRAWQAHATAERTKTHTSLLAIAATAHLPGYVLLAAPKNVYYIWGIISDRIAPQSRRSRGRTSRRTAVPRAPRHRETAAQRSRGDAADGSCLRHYHRHHAADFDLQLAPTSPPAIGGRIVLLLRGDFSSRATSFCHPRDGWDHITIGLRAGSSRVTFPSD